MHRLSPLVEALMRDTARDAVMPYYQKLTANQIEQKTPTPNGLEDLVTIADKEAEAMLAKGLHKILPDAAIVGEEATTADPLLLDRLSDALCWIIDPVDGTNNFGAGKPPFGIMVALAEGGNTVAGWMLDPLTGRMCHASRDGGAWINGERIIARESGAERPQAAISVLFLDPDRRDMLKARLDGVCDLVDIPRCAAEQYPRLVLGTNDISLFERTLPWDHAPGALFANEAGAKVARLDGTSYRPASRERGMIGASSPRMWDVAAALIND